MDLVFRQPPETELIAEYRPGGLHPVHIGDKFQNGRYEVVRKLGCGGYATIWLVSDNSVGGYAALKILRADADDREVDILRRLQQGKTSDDDCILRVLDLFVHSGANGTHQCVVTEILGPSLAAVEDDLEDIYDDEVLPPEVAQCIALQVAHGVERLHRLGIAHGDLTKRNVLLYAPVVKTWASIADVDAYMNEPQLEPVRIHPSGDPASPSPHRPTYTVYGLLSSRMTRACFEDPLRVRVKLVDFGEAFVVAPPHVAVARTLHIPPSYAAPEVLLRMPVGLPADVWALAVLVHDLVSCGWPLFARVTEVRPDSVLAGIFLRRGRLPNSFWTTWKDRSRFFDDAGAWIGAEEDRPFASVDEGHIISAKVSKERCGGDLDGFKQLVTRLTEVDLGSRASIQEAVGLMQRLWTTKVSAVPASATAG